jgi:glyoxalase family protein
VPENLLGIHHVTAITGDVQRNVDFYVRVLGLRFIKKTINFDVPDTYHLYFGDWLGTPGTIMTFFGWPDLPWRPPGCGQVTAISFALPMASVQFWYDRLRRLAVEVTQGGRFDAEVLTLYDPDRIQIELVGEANDEGWVPWSDGPVAPAHAIRRFHSVTLRVRQAEPSVRFFTELLGFTVAGHAGMRTRLTTGGGAPSRIIELLEDPHGPTGQEAVGTVHHVAWRSADEQHQSAWRRALLAAGRPVTPVIDRKYFHSIYFREPGGVLLEIATDGPGFTVDEPAEALGSTLKLPPQQEARRQELDLLLPPISIPTTKPG